MFTGSSTFRFFLAAVVALWSPLACCCLTQAAPDASSAPAGAACHVQTQPKSACAHCPSQADEQDSSQQPAGPGKCGCAKVGALEDHREPVAKAIATDVMGLLVALLHLPLARFDLAPATVIHASPPGPAIAGAPHSLFTLHCLLTV